MTVIVLAESLEAGNVVELSTRYGSCAIRLAQVERRLNGIKFTGRDTRDSVMYSFGMKYGQSATRLDC
ncbi:hypothetical protein [Streptomyces sp. NPDC058441]|uniref:hypothetical protein n=1 Tax=Streptomyces sp. NPDC058441 TaxID=3346502 RepID=UPI00365D2E04